MEYKQTRKIIKHLLKQRKYFLFSKKGEEKGRKTKPIQNVQFIMKYLIEGRELKEIRDAENVMFDLDKKLLYDTFYKEDIDRNVNQNNDKNNMNKEIPLKSDNIISDDNQYSHDDSDEHYHIDTTTHDIESSAYSDTLNIPVEIPKDVLILSPEVLEKNKMEHFNETKGDPFVLEYLKNGKQVKEYIPYPLLFNLNEEQTNQYIDLYKYLRAVGKRNYHTNWDSCRILEMIAYVQPKVFERTDLLLEPHVLFAKLWMNSVLNPYQLIFVDDGEDSGYYLFTEKCVSKEAPYHKLTDTQAIGCIKKFIYELFNNKPPSMVCDYEFAKATLQNIKLDITMTKSNYKDTLPPGLAFKNGYIGHFEEDCLLTFIPFGKRTFVTDVIPVNIEKYALKKESVITFLKTERKELTDSITMNIEPIKEDMKLESLNKPDFMQDYDPLDEIQATISKEDFQTLLKVLTEEDPIKAVALRSMLRRIITALRDGTNYQQGWWLYGPPSSGKTTFFNICRLIAQGSFVELSKSRNQFTALSLKDAKLITISDVSKLTTDMIELLRCILGRDSIYGEKKHENGTYNIRSCALVIISSNSDPNEYPQIMGVPEIRDKITTLKFNHMIPQEFMVGNMEKQLEKYMWHFFLWSMFTPSFFLEQQTRARLLRQYMENKGVVNRSYFHDYIEERLLQSCYVQQDIFLPISEIRTDFETWVADNSLLEDITDIAKTMKYLPAKLVEILNVDYQIRVEKIRPRVPGKRIYAIKGIKLYEKDYDKNNFKRIEIHRGKSFDFGNRDPYTTVEYLSQSSADNDKFMEIQQSILKDRRKSNLEEGIVL